MLTIFFLTAIAAITGIQNYFQRFLFSSSLFINLNYDFQDSSLVLKIVRASNLAAKDLGGTSDPYVRIMLLPDKKHKLETKVRTRVL